MPEPTPISASLDFLGKGPNTQAVMRAVRDAARRNTARRERVLAHPWARARLCLILDLKNADQWNGYVPPRWDPEEDTHRNKAGQLTNPRARENRQRQANDSVKRAELVQLLRDVQEFEEKGEIPASDGVPNYSQATLPVSSEMD